jgi:hypothetical protein
MMVTQQARGSVDAHGAQGRHRPWRLFCFSKCPTFQMINIDQQCSPIHEQQRIVRVWRVGKFRDVSTSVLFVALLSVVGWTSKKIGLSFWGRIGWFVRFACVLEGTQFDGGFYCVYFTIFDSTMLKIYIAKAVRNFTASISINFLYKIKLYVLPVYITIMSYSHDSNTSSCSPAASDHRFLASNAPKNLIDHTQPLQNEQYQYYQKPRATITNLESFMKNLNF